MRPRAVGHGVSSMCGSVEPGLGDLQLHLPDPQQHLVTERLRRVLGARPCHQCLHGPLEVVLLQAGPALVEMVLDLREVGVRQLVVDEEEHPLEDLGAVLVLGGTTRSGARGLAHRPSPFAAVAADRPRLRAYSWSMSRSCRRPRCSRDITVPIGVSMISAISLYGKPSTSARYTASRKSSGSCWRASLTSLSGRCSRASASADFRPLEECDSARATCQSSTSSAMDCCGSRCFLR